MSTTIVILLVVGITGYLALVACVLGLCRLAHRADEANQRPRLVVVRTERFQRRVGDELPAGQRAEREVRGP
jgi:hypothetical protein